MTAGAALGLGPAARAQDGTVIGSVLWVVGSAVLEREGMAQAVTVGMAVQRRDRIATPPGGRVSIDLGDGALVVVGEATAVDLTDVAPGAPRSATLDLLGGILRLSSPSDGNWTGLQVSAPTAIASVRATEWVVDASAENTAVFVARGAVMVIAKATADWVVLQPGQGTDVPAGGPPQPPKMWGEGRIAGVMARTAPPPGSAPPPSGD